MLVQVVWPVAALLLLCCCAPSSSSAGCVNRQHSQILLDGNLADVLLTKDTEHLVITITSKAGKESPPDWSKVKAWAGCFPYAKKLGGFSFGLALVKTNTVNGKDAGAVFARKGEPSAINDISDVVVTTGPNQCLFSLPLSSQEVLVRFRARVSKEEFHQLQELRHSRDLKSQERALELVLFKLTPGELHRVGVEKKITDPDDGTDFWAVAGGAYVVEEVNAVEIALRDAQIGCWSIGMCGGISWYVTKEQFFRARRALLGAKGARVRTRAVPPPKFSFE